MKTRKLTGKIAATLLCLILTLSMLPMSVLANNTSGNADPSVFDTTITTGSLTINKTDGAGTAIADTTLEYTIYKVATVNQTTTTAGVTTMEYILDNGITLNSGAITGNGTTVAVPVGTTAASFDTTSLPTGTSLTNAAGSGTLTFSGLSLGLYLVRETVTPASVSVANDFLVSIPLSVAATSIAPAYWEYDPVAAPKNTVVDGSVAKTVTSGATGVTGATNTWTASLGNAVAYQIDAVLPSTFITTPYTTYTITDTPAEDLIIDFAGSGTAANYDGIVVTVTPNGSTTATTLTYGTDYTITAVAAVAGTSSAGFKVELITSAPASTTTAAGTNFSSSLTNKATVTVAYSATLDPAATASSFVNAVKVDNTYNTAGGTVTPPAITPPTTNPNPTVVTYNYALQKVDGDALNAPLDGATFAIQNASGAYLTWTATAGWGTATGVSDPDLYTFTSSTAGTANAIVPFNGLAGGSYDIVELSAPAGYSQLTAPINVTIDATSSADANTSTGGAGYSVQVVNSKASFFTLPVTGGMGIYVFTIGGVLLLGAATFLFTANRKRKNSTNA